MNIKDKILGKRISGIFNALNILLGLFCIIYYSINANRVNEFNKAVDFYLVLAIMCCGIYVFADYVIADIFNLIAVVFITLSIGKMIVNKMCIRDRFMEYRFMHRHILCVQCALHFCCTGLSEENYLKMDIMMWIFVSL